MPAIYNTYEDYQDAVIRSADRLIEQCGGFGEATDHITRLLAADENKWLAPLLADVECEVYAQEQDDWEARTCVDGFSGPTHDIDDLRRRFLSLGRRPAAD